jgi:hypothetical protein
MFGDSVRKTFACTYIIFKVEMVKLFETSRRHFCSFLGKAKPTFSFKTIEFHENCTTMAMLSPFVQLAKLNSLPYTLCQT